MAGSFEVVWQRDFHMRPEAMQARAADGALVTLERDTRLVRLDPLTGELRWEVKVEDAWGALALGDDVCIYVSQHGTMRCVDLASGQVRWVKSGRDVQRHLCVAPGAVISGAWRGYRALQGYDLDSGQQLWSRGGPGEPPSTVRLSPFDNQISDEIHRPERFGDGVLICPRNGRDLWSIDARTGAVVEHWDLPEPIAATSDERAFWPTGDGRVTFACGPSLVAVLDPVDGVSIVWADPENQWTGAQRLSGARLWMGRRNTIILRDITIDVQEELPMEEGPVSTAVIPVQDGVFALSRAGFLLKYNLAGQVVTQIRVSRRAYELHSAAKGLVHVTAKGTVVGVRWNG